MLPMSELLQTLDRSKPNPSCYMKLLQMNNARNSSALNSSHSVGPGFWSVKGGIKHSVVHVADSL